MLQRTDRCFGGDFTKGGVIGAGEQAQITGVIAPCSCFGVVAADGLDKLVDFKVQHPWRVNGGVILFRGRQSKIKRISAMIT